MSHKYWIALWVIGSNMSAGVTIISGGASASRRLVSMVWSTFNSSPASYRSSTGCDFLCNVAITNFILILTIVVGYSLVIAGS